MRKFFKQKEKNTDDSKSKDQNNVAAVTSTTPAAITPVYPQLRYTTSFNKNNFPQVSFQQTGTVNEFHGIDFLQAKTVEEVLTIFSDSDQSLIKNKNFYLKKESDSIFTIKKIVAKEDVGENTKKESSQGKRFFRASMRSMLVYKIVVDSEASTWELTTPANIKVSHEDLLQFLPPAAIARIHEIQSEVAAVISNKEHSTTTSTSFQLSPTS